MKAYAIEIAGGLVVAVHEITDSFGSGVFIIDHDNIIVSEGDDTNRLEAALESVCTLSFIDSTMSHDDLIKYIKEQYHEPI